jgi:hypothetical protein
MGESAMELKEWILKLDIDMVQAAKSFGVSHHAIRKWLRHERTPRPAMQRKIKRISRGAITPSDWIK